jgi:hypothetical protein
MQDSRDVLRRPDLQDVYPETHLEIRRKNQGALVVRRDTLLSEAKAVYLAGTVPLAFW